MTMSECRKILKGKSELIEYYRSAFEAAKAENAELRAALEEIRDSKACWFWNEDEVAHWTEVDGNTDSFVAPHLAAWLRQQEVTKR